MLKKLKQQAHETYNKHFNQEKYSEMKEEEQRDIQNFKLFNTAYVEGEMNGNAENKNLDSEEKQEEKNEINEIPIDFTKAIIPEELVQQMQEEDIQKLAIENEKSKAKKKETNNELPNFLTQKICLDENGENYYEKAAAQAKLQNSAMFKLKSYVSEKANSASKEVKKQLKKLDSHVKKKILEKKSHINLWIAGQVDTQIVTIMSKMEPKIASSVEKSVPFDCLQGFVHDSAINLWKDFTDLIRLELRVKITPPKMEIRKRDQKGPIYAFRNFILYSLYPADLTARKHMRRISFLIMKFCCMVPYLCLQPIMFCIILICINKDEEYQLVNYIADLKSLQFLTNGLFPCIIAYFHYFFFDEGPGNQQMWHVLITTTLLFQINVWIAYFLLARSYSRGAFLKEQLTITTDEKGGRLKFFLFYDFICFLLTISISILIYYFKIKQNTQVNFGDLLYLSRTVYAFFSFPFLIFLFPFFVKMLTNAIPTGYDQYGNCIPALNSIQMSYIEVPFSRTEEVDIEDILDRDDDQKDDKKLEIIQEESNIQKKKEKKKGFYKTTA